MSKRAYESSSDDEERPSNASFERLSWRLPPEESHSDWTIEVSESGVKSPDGMPATRSFHVHKNVLSVGPKRSEYFLRLFQSKYFAEAESHTSRIELDPIAAESFPQLLDYLYSPGTNLSRDAVSTNNATTLHFLGEYFEIASLRFDAFRFCKSDMQIDNCDTYFEQAQILHNEKVLKLVAKKCCDRLYDINQYSPLLKASDTSLWREVIRLIRKGRLSRGSSYTSKHSEQLSLLIAQFCRLHPSTIDAETFKYFTEATHMMAVHSEAAVTLMEMEKSLLLVVDSSQLSCLQTRCVACLVSSWETLDSRSLHLALSDISHLVLDRVFTQAFNKAKGKAEEAMKEVKEAANKAMAVGTQAKELERRAKAAEAQVKYLTSQVERDKSQIVKQITVRGAGDSHANGTYFRCDDLGYHDQPRFRQEGCGYLLFLSKKPNDHSKLYWWIGPEDEDDYEHNNPEDAIYFANHSEGDLYIPVRNGWKVAKKGEGNTTVAPAPTLRLSARW